MLLLAMPSLARAAEPLAGQWHFDTTTPFEGGNATPDSSGHGNDLQGNPIVLADGGRFNKYLSESNVRPMQTVSGLPMQRMTLMAWIKKTGDPIQGAVIAAQGTDSATCNHLSYALYSGGDGGPDLYFEIRQPGGSGGTLVDSPHFSGAADGTWHLVAGTFDGTTVRLYVDGVQIGSGTPTSIGSIVYGTPTAFGADGYHGGNSCPAGPDFSGGIDELRVYDRALSPTEIGRLAAATGPNPPDLVPDQPPPPNPVASFSLLISKVKFLHSAIFDARGTRNASKLIWDISGGGRDEHLVEPASNPVLAVRLPTPGLYKVTLTASGFNGLVSSFSHFLRVTGRFPRTRRIRHFQVPVTSVSAASYRPGLHGERGNEVGLLCGGVGQGVTFGVAQARGCFDTITDLAKVPLLEQAIARYDYLSYSLPAVVASICTQAAQGQLPQSRCVEAMQLFGADTIDAYSSSKDVHLNGLTIHPVSPAHVVLFPRAGRVICSLCIVSWGGIPVFAGPVDWNLGHDSPHYTTIRADLLYFDASKLGDIAGFHPTGSVSLVLRRDLEHGQFSSEGKVELSLPNEFTLLGGKPPSAVVKLIGTNDQAPVLDHLDLRVPEANFGAFDVTDVRFRYERKGGIDGDTNPGTSCQRNQWKAQAKIYLLSPPGPDSGSSVNGSENGSAPTDPHESAAGLSLAPPPSQNGVGFCAGNFKNAGAQLTFGKPPESPLPEPEIFPTVFLHQINFAMQLHPTLLRGGAGLDAAQLVYTDGALLAAFAKPSEPYYLNAADAGNEFAVLAGRTFTSTTFAVGGDVFMAVPEYGKIRMGSGAMMYSYPNYIYAAGQVRVVGPGFAMYGGVSGDFDLGTRKFQTHGSVTGCLGGLDEGACTGAEGWLGTRGIALCLNATAFGQEVHPGLGFRWDGFFDAWPADGCKPSEFWEENVHAAHDQTAGAAAASLTVRLARGEGVKNIQLIGAGSSPEVKVTSPDGRSLTITGEHYVFAKNLAGFRHLHGNQTFIGISGAPGVYRIDPLPGSAPIVRLLDTRKGYDSNFTAHVRRSRGGAMTLRYDARRPERQIVTFAERGHNVFKVLGTSHGGRGRIRFTPAIGPGGRRQIVAIPTLDGVPIPDQVLTTYVAPGVPRTGHPQRVRVRRHGTTLSVRWAAARGATRYAVVLRLSDGFTRAFKVRARRRNLRIGGIPRYLSGTVQVSARGVLGDWASPTSARFKRLILPPTAQQTRRHNERLTYLRSHPKQRRRHK